MPSQLENLYFFICVGILYLKAYLQYVQCIYIYRMEREIAVVVRVGAEGTVIG